MSLLATCETYADLVTQITQLIMGLALVNSLSYNSKTEAQSVWSTVGTESDYSDVSERPFALTNVGSHDGIDYVDDVWGGGAKGVKQAKKWLEGSYELWKQWTGYLVEDALEPHNQRKYNICLPWELI